MTGPRSRFALLAALRLGSISGVALLSSVVPGATAQTVRDSAGITIVENDRPVGKSWKVDSKPSLDIGGGEDSLFQFYEIMGVTRLRDGRIAVADMGTNQIRVYTPDGRLATRLGRSGKGPGEFTQLMGLVRIRGDTLLANNSHLGYLVFSDQGKYVAGILKVPGDGPGVGAYSLYGAFDDGTLVGSKPQVFGGPGGSRPKEPTVFTSGIVRLDREGKVVTDFGDFPTFTYPELIYSPYGAVAVKGNRMLVGYARAYSFRVISPDGKTERIIRRKWTAPKVTSEHINAYREDFTNPKYSESRTVTPEFRKFREGRFKELKFAETLPAFSRIVADDEGNLWVKEVHVSDFFSAGRFGAVHDVPSRWSVFDREGRWLTDVDLPRNFRVHEISGDAVIGTSRDEDDVEHVVVYRLIKAR